MGYFGLEHWSDSDNAADFHELVVAIMGSPLTVSKVSTLITAFENELKDEANEYNTPGYVNIALSIEDGALNALSNEEKRKMSDVISQTIAKLSLTISKKRCDSYHAKAYKRMVKNLTKFLEGIV